MLYLLTPPAEVRACDVPGAATLGVAAKYGVDLASLEWRSSGVELTAELLAVALRHGHPVSTGIVIDAALVTASARERPGPSEPDEIARQTLRAAGLQMVTLGFTYPAGGLVAALIEASTPESIPSMAELLAAPISEGLTEHWRELGGS